MGCSPSEKEHLDELDAAVARLTGARQIGGGATGNLSAAAVITTIGAYTYSAGVITVTAVGALGTQDSTYVPRAGDTVLLPEFAAQASVDAGPYLITAVGGASAQTVLTRPWYWQDAGVFGGVQGTAPCIIPLGTIIEIGPGGTLWAGTSWKTFATRNQVVGTNGPALYPRELTQPIALVSGTATISNVPIKSTTKTQFVFSRTSASNPNSTVTYQPLGITAGIVQPGGAAGASVIYDATLLSGLINAADNSLGNFTIINW